jgi:hypothetical protein
MGLSALGEFELLSLVRASFLYRIGQQTPTSPDLSETADNQ